MTEDYGKGGGSWAGMGQDRKRERLDEPPISFPSWSLR
jgi:hypothetical protein